MKIKVCGMREPDNIAEVADLGPDYLGYIFYAGSPRFAGQPSLAKWMGEHRIKVGHPKRVGVFVNAEVDYLLNTVHDFQLDWVQLHGDESPGYCRELKLLWSVDTLRRAEICKAFSITDDFDFRDTNPYVDSCSMFVFDTGGTKAAGGTGLKWNWDKLQEYTGPVPFLLSGGIGPDDVEALKRLDHKQMRGVDVNSKFEISPGVKDVDQLRTFIAALH